MDSAPIRTAPRRRHAHDRVVLHFCIENRQPSLKALPLGIKQKGILATCNYVARRYGVKKLMPIFEARKICPDLVLADGEDLSPFRDVSKRLYALLRSYSWNGKIERLGLDEMFLDVTDIVSYNVELLNRNTLQRSYFCLSRVDPEVGFEYDATSFAGCVYGEDGEPSIENVLRMRLLLASHLARYLRLKIEEDGYTTACGIATNKLLAKLVGDRFKPRNQTTLLALRQEDVVSFMDEHSLRKIPGIGSKITRVLEGFVLGKEPDPDTYSMECSTTAAQVRTHPGISPPTLEKLLSGPGAEKGLGTKVWSLLHGIDTAEVKPARDVPTQISIEDSYRGLTDPSEIQRALVAITTSLLRRMHTDLVEEITTTTTLNANPTPHLTPSHVNTPAPKRRWLARPKTLRLSTSPYTPFPSEATPPNPPYPNRTSRSTPLPSFVFTTTNLNNNPPPLEETAARLVTSTLLPLFHKLHPNPNPNPNPNQDPDPVTGTGIGTNRDTNKGPGGWNIGVMNVCVTNMVGAGVDGGGGGGGGGAGARDIGEMFRRQEGVLSQFRVREDGDGEGGGGGGGGDEDEEEEEGGYGKGGCGAGDGDGDGDESKGEGYRGNGLVEAMSPRYGRRDVGEDEKEEQQEEGESETLWDDEETPEDDLGRCPRCDRLIPGFAMSAHERYHSLEDP